MKFGLVLYMTPVVVCFFASPPDLGCQWKVRTFAEIVQKTCWNTGMLEKGTYPRYMWRFSASLRGGPRNQLYIGAHNSTYGGERTPVTHVFSAFYRSYSHIYNWFSGAHLVIPMEPHVWSDHLEEQKCPKPTWAVIFKYSPRPFWHIPSLTPG